MIAAAKVAPLLDNQQGVIRTWYSREDIVQLQEYNDLITYESASIAKGLNKQYKDLMDNMSNTAKAAVEAANGGVVALDKLNKGFNWAALGAKALNFALNFGIAAALSIVVSWISNLIHRVERAHQATAAYKKSVVTLSQLMIDKQISYKFCQVGLCHSCHFFTIVLQIFKNQL